MRFPQASGKSQGEGKGDQLSLLGAKCLFLLQTELDSLLLSLSRNLIHSGELFPAESQWVTQARGTSSNDSTWKLGGGRSMVYLLVEETLRSSTVGHPEQPHLWGVLSTNSPSLSLRRAMSFALILWDLQEFDCKSGHRIWEGSAVGCLTLVYR